MNLGKGKKMNVHVHKKKLRFLENQLHRKVKTCVESLKASSWNWFKCVQIIISGETAGSQLGTHMYTRFSQEFRYFHLCIYERHLCCVHQHMH